MKLRSKQIQGDTQNPKPRNKVIAEQICQIPLQHLKGTYFRRVMYVPEQNLIIAQGYFKQFLLAKIVDNKIEPCDYVNLKGYSLQLLVIHKKQQLLAINGQEMIKLKLSNFNIIEKVNINYGLTNNYQYIIQDEKYVNNNFIIFDHIRLQFRKIKDLKLIYQMVWIQIPSNIKLDRHWFSYEAKYHYYIHNNLRGKMIRKLQGPFINPLKNFNSIILRPNRYIDGEHCTEIINPNSMRVVCQLYAKQGQYRDSFLIEEQKILLILNKKNIMAYDANYKLLEEVQLPNYGIPYKLNYHKSQYKIQKQNEQ
ncbi:hypothetical protein pb186bvf_008738 [Paramecium bursaria]